MKYFSFFAGPASAFSIVGLANPFWWLRIQGISALLAIAWMLVWSVVEVIWLLRNQAIVPRLLTHLRWGPVAVLLVATSTVACFDQIMIYRSRQLIREYVNYNPADDDLLYDLKLHTYYRGWCGNGYQEAISNTYLDTAMEGFSSTDPAVRLRSLKISRRVAGFADEPKFRSLMRRASNDSDDAVREFAGDYLTTTGY